MARLVVTRVFVACIVVACAGTAALWYAGIFTTSGSQQETAAQSGGNRSAVREAGSRGKGASLPVTVEVATARAVAGSSGILFTLLKSELAPLEDRGVIRVRGTGPEGATVTFTARYAAAVDEILKKVRCDGCRPHTGDASRRASGDAV